MPPGVEFPLRSELWIPLAVLGEGSRDATWRALHRGDRAPETGRADRSGARRNAHHRQPAGAGVSAHQPRPLGVGAPAARIARRQRPPVDVRAAGRGGPRAADRLRQRGQPGADSRCQPRPRAGRARGRRRGPIQPVSRIADREPRARRHRRRRRPGPRVLGHHRDRVARSLDRRAAAQSDASRRGGRRRLRLAWPCSPRCCSGRCPPGMRRRLPMWCRAFARKPAAPRAIRSASGHAAC